MSTACLIPDGHEDVNTSCIRSPRRDAGWFCSYYGPGSVADGRSNDDTVDDIRFLDDVRALPAAAARKARLAVALGVADGDLVIEVGPGTGEDLERFAVVCGDRGMAVGVDISLALLQEAQRRTPGATVVVADARHLPFRAGVFARGYAERVLQHVPEVETAVAELYRVLQDGGRALVFEPDQELRARDHPDFEAERLLRPRLRPQVVNPAIGRQLFRLLTVAGFTVESVDGTAAGQRLSTAVEETVDAVSAAVRDGDLDAARGDAYLATLRHMEATGGLFSVWVAFEVTATA